jgi:YidC/Oxa1 family membrane protein insertase
VKKTDLNSVIGFTLIGLILLGYSYFNSTEEPAPATIDNVASDTVAPSELQEAEPIIAQEESALPDSLQNLKLREEFGLFYSNVQTAAEEQFFTLENEKLRLLFSSKGARIVEAELKGYQTYDSLPLMLVNGNQDWQFIMQGDKLYESSDLYFSVVANDDKIVFEAPSTSGSPLKIEYRLIPDSYQLELSSDMSGLGFSESAIDWEMTALRHERNLDTENQQTSLQYLLAEKKKHKELSATSEDEEEGDGVKWLAYKQQFFTSILLADKPFSKARMSSFPMEDEQRTKRFASIIQLADKDQFEGKLIFTPNQYDLLKAHGEEFEEIIPLGWGIFGWINRGVVINVFQQLEKLGLNYGLIILIMALLIKVVLLPLTYTSYLSMAKMRVLKPEIDELNEKFADKDPMKKQSAMMELYRKAGVNPLGGCIPVLLQFPILIAVFRFFPASIELRQKSFLWADDLSTYDSIYALPFDIPFYGDHVSLFTLLMTISTLIYTYYNNQLTQQNNQFPQLKYMMYLMPVMFLGFFNNYAAGLSYYYFVANMLTFGQQFAIRNMVNDEAIHAKLQENKKKPKKQSKFQQRLEKMAEQQKEAAKSNRKMRRQ